MPIVVKPEGKYLKFLCRALHIDPECRDDLPEAIQSAMMKVLSVLMFSFALLQMSLSCLP